MLDRLALPAALTLALAPASLAQCPDTALQAVVTTMGTVDQPGANLVEASKIIDEQAVMCAADPYVLKIAAMTKFNIARRATTPAEVFRLASEAWALYNSMDDALGSSQPPRSAMLNGRIVAIGFDDLYDLGKTLLHGVFQSEGLAGQTIPEHAPLTAGAPAGACRDDWDIQAQHAYAYIRERGYADAPMNFLNRAVSACHDSIEQGADRHILAHRSRALMAAAEKGAGPDNAIQTAASDGDRFYKRAGGYRSPWWTESDDRKLRELLLKAGIASGATVAREDWFKPENIGASGTEMSIALALDEAWATDEKNGGIRSAYKSYRDAISSAYGQAMALSDPMAARWMLSRAAEAHAKGRVRRPENAALPAPPDFLWNWITPKPAAAPH